MTRVVFTPFSVISGVLAGLIAARVFEQVWKRFAGDDVVPEPSQRWISWPAMIVAMTLEGAIFRLVRAVVDRGSRVAFVRLTGRWPGEEDRPT